MDVDIFSEPNALIVGVTGRRRVVPAARARVEASARAFFRTTAEIWRENGPIFVLTGLAIGADQLAARLVLEEKARDSASPFRLVAVSPMGLAEYANDFSRDAGDGKRSELEEFQRLWNAADVVLELPSTPENVERTRRGAAIDRTAQYSALGDLLVERSRILLAFWNGNASDVKRGGTVDVVLRKARRDAGRDELVYCVATPEVLRRKNPDGTKLRIPEPIENAGNVAILTPPTTDAPRFLAPERAEELRARFPTPRGCRLA